MSYSDADSSSNLCDEEITPTSRLPTKDTPHVLDRFHDFAEKRDMTHPPDDFIAVLIEGSSREYSLSASEVIRFHLQREDYVASKIIFDFPHKTLPSWIEYVNFMLKFDIVREHLSRERILQAIKSSVKSLIIIDMDGLPSFLARWCPRTRSFILAWGELVITLEDVAALLHLPVFGNLSFGSWSDVEKTALAELKRVARYINRGVGMPIPTGSSIGQALREVGLHC